MTILSKRRSLVVVTLSMKIRGDFCCKEWSIKVYGKTELLSSRWWIYIMRIGREASSLVDAEEGPLRTHPANVLTPFRKYWTPDI